MKKRMIIVLVAFVLLAAPTAALARQYIIPDSDTRQLTKTELWQWDYESLGYILNEIMARHGYTFNAGGNYEAYFSKLSWYEKNANPDNQSQVYEKLSSLEWYNEGLVKDVRKEMRDSGNRNPNGKHYLDYITFDSGGGGSASIDFAYASFNANQKFAVYAAPGSGSYRGANGRASVSTNGPVYVAGWDGGWLLLMYDTNNGAVRVGYVDGDDINGRVSAPYLQFANTTVTCTETVNLTDDPVTYRSNIARIASGTSVIYLASYYEGRSWAYIETRVDGQTVRGFIPESAIQ